MPSESLIRTALDLRMGGVDIPPLKLPDDFEAAKTDGWCLIARRGGALAVVNCPLNVRDDKTGETVGEVAVLEARRPSAIQPETPYVTEVQMGPPGAPDLWGLVVFARMGELPDDFAQRVRLAMITRRPGSA